MALQKKFIDLDLNFNIHPETDDIVRVYDEVAIKNAVKHLILTHFYSRPFHPEIGSHVAGLLFEPDSHMTKMALDHSIRQVINNFERRVDITDIIINYNDADYGYRIELFMDVVGILESVSIEFLLHRIR